jgi:hypothetical protein
MDRLEEYSRHRPSHKSESVAIIVGAKECWKQRTTAGDKNGPLLHVSCDASIIFKWPSRLYDTICTSGLILSYQASIYLETEVFTWLLVSWYHIKTFKTRSFCKPR